MKDVKQLNLTAGKQTLFEMKLKRSQFLVKNMTDDSISVSLGNNDTECYMKITYMAKGS